MRDMAQTSLESFTRLVDEGNMGQRQRQVYSYIAFHPSCSDREIAEGTGLPINVVCGRRNELSRMGYILKKTIKHDERTNRNVAAWRVL